MGSTAKPATPENYTLLQGFEWNCPPDGKHWIRLRDHLPALKATGIDNIWLPPGCKASGPEGNGYDIYDLYDLGEFEQKGTRATKWGNKEQLMDLCKKAKELGVGLYWDGVLNHKAAADKKEKCMVVDVDQNDRNKAISEPHEIEAWLGFEFPGRGDEHSKQKYHHYHFTGTDYDAATGKKGVFKIQGENKGWSQSVDDEGGNADFLMFADLDYSHQEVVDDVKNWGEWIIKETGIKGFRLDAVQHFSQRFTNEWIDQLNSRFGGDKLFYVGEFWTGDRDTMVEWMKGLKHNFCLFDSPLLYNFSTISTSEKADLRKVFDGSLVEVEPDKSVTAVMNHDTQPGQTVETPISGWFKPLAYALMLLTDKGYPCVFYGDLYGMRGEKPEPPSCGGALPKLILARKLYGYGDQDNYFEEANCIGWVRRGTEDRPHGCAVVMSNAAPGERRMFVGEGKKGQTWTDVLGWQDREVRIGDDGFALFPCAGTSVSIWASNEAEGRHGFEKGFDANIYKE